MTTYTCRTYGIALDTVAQADDGDTIQLAWPGANGFSKAAIESRALALGLNIIVEIPPQKGPDHA